jgi:hypothetical protein
MKDRAMESWAARLRSRRPWTKDEAREVLKRQAASGLSVEKFAQQAGFVPQRLSWWRKRLANACSGQRTAAPASSPSFVPVVVRASEWHAGGGSTPLRVRIGERVVVDVERADAGTAAWVAWLALACSGGGES